MPAFAGMTMDIDRQALTPPRVVPGPQVDRPYPRSADHPAVASLSPTSLGIRPNAPVGLLKYLRSPGEHARVVATGPCRRVDRRRHGKAGDAQEADHIGHPAIEHHRLTTGQCRPMRRNLALDHLVGEGAVVEPRQRGAADRQLLLDD